MRIVRPIKSLRDQASELTRLDSAAPVQEAGTTTGAIELRDLRREFGERVALRDVSLSLGTGETLAVLGPNGAGKTTLMRILAGLLRPSGGTVVVLGADLPKTSWELRGKVGWLGHDPLLYRDLTAAENLRFAARLNGLDRPAGAARIDSLLDSVGLARRADDRVRDFSAGMVQRTAICRAVLHEPELLLLDEPYSHLDSEARQLVEPLIGPASGATRVLVSHEADAASGADQVLRLDATGRPLEPVPA
jgi:heme exporter protein A